MPRVFVNTPILQPHPSAVLVPNPFKNVQFNNQKQEIQKSNDFTVLPLAAVFFLTGLLLHRLPMRNRPGKTNLFPTDWKAWARVVLGIFTVANLNKALAWKPPPWLSGIETVAIMLPMAAGFSKGTFRKLLFVAPLVAGFVQTGNTLNQWFKKVNLDSDWKIPSWASRLTISIALALLGAYFLPKLSKKIAEKGLLGKLSEAEKEVLVSGVATCEKGCSVGGVVCLSELGGMLGGIGNWFRSSFTSKTSPERQW